MMPQGQDAGTAPVDLDARRDGRLDPSVGVLVDFQNAYNNHAYGEDFDWFVPELHTLVEDALHADPDPRGILLQLYGSWLENGQLTKQASLAQQAIAKGPSFPLVIRSRLVHGNVQLALALADAPAVQWHTFVKRQRGLSRMKVAKVILPQRCKDDKKSCPVRCLQDFATKRERKCIVDDCSVTNSQAFETISQKMVDTFLACDLVALARRGSFKALVLVTGDVDLLPAIAVAASLRGPAITLVAMSGEPALAPYLNTLQQLGVTVIHRSPQ